MRQPLGVVRNASGLFWNDRYKAIIESIVNLVVSIILGKLWGILGILVGTTISTVTVSGWVEPYVIYKHSFKKTLFVYLTQYFQYLTVTLIAGAVTYYACSFTANTLLGFALKLIICIAIPNVIYLALYFRKKEFLAVWHIFQTKILRKFKKVI